MKYLAIGQCQKAPNFFACHWYPHGSLVSIGQHFVTTRVVHLPKRTEISLITESDLVAEWDQAVLAVHSCNSWLIKVFTIHSTGMAKVPFYVMSVVCKGI